MFDTNEQDVLAKLATWGNLNNNVRALLLTSSRTNIHSKPDKLSDYDVEIVVDDMQFFKTDKWLDYFGETLVKWPLTPKNTGFYPESITRLVVFKDFPRVDFQIINKQHFDGTAYDNGYKIILDKDNLEANITLPTLKAYIIKKPSKHDYYETIDGFYWDLPYIAKSLRRGEVTFARYMLLSAIRYASFERMLAWYIGANNNWAVNFGVHGRNVERLVDQDLANEINSICAGGNAKEIWQATLSMVDIFNRLSKEISAQLDYVDEPVNKKEVLKLCDNILNLTMD